jgi:trehalose 6-phosphate synthase/phosphatase
VDNNFNFRNDPEVPEMISLLKEKYAGKKIVIGRDKSDYVKGVRQKLLAFERFLYLYPEWAGKVVLIQVALSTIEANENECNVSDVVARINSKFGSIEYMPVVYLHQDISFSHYLALLTVNIWYFSSKDRGCLSHYFSERWNESYIT